MFEKQTSRQYDASPDVVYQALCTYAEQAQQVMEQDAGGRAVTFLTRRTLFSWGHVVTAQVLEAPTGSELEVVVTGLPDAPRALMDGKKNARTATRLLDDIAAQLR